MKRGSFNAKASTYLVVFVLACSMAITMILHVMQVAVASDLYSLPTQGYTD
jgi:hypothetical protein